jgi:transposase
MTTRGIEDVYTTTGSVNGEKFIEYFCQCVLPIIMPFDGQNPRSIVVMDNASIHHLDKVHEIITGVGAKLCFLPPYSPDLMPLEEVFSKVKYFLKANDSAYLCTSSPEDMVKIAFSTITQDNCINYIKHAGYM